jgi:hypothetical protein
MQMASASNVGKDLVGHAEEALANYLNTEMIIQEENFMDLDPLCYGPPHPPVPPGYDQCAATPVTPKADYVVSPLAMAALFDWDDEDE